MKTRLNLVFAAVIAMMPAVFFGQATFDKFETDVNFTTVTVTKKTFSMLAQIKAEGSEKDIQQVKDLAKKIESFKVIATEKPGSVGDLKATTEKYIKSAGLEELMKIREKGADFRVMIKQANETQISEILVFVQEADKKAGAVTLIVKGLFDLDELTEITEKVLPKATDTKIDAKLSDVKDALVLKVSPNPASGVFYINATTPAEVKLYDASGRLVKTEQYSNEGVSTAGIAPGTYVVEINTEGRRQTEHIVIK
jgi:hypothetical protein